MDLRSEILKEHSKNQSDKIAEWIGSDKKRFSALLEILLHGEDLLVQRSSWIVSNVAERHPEIVAPHLKKLVARMKDNGVHDAVKRHITGILQSVDIPEALHGDVMNTCFNFLADPREAIAVRCNSITVLSNLSKTYPEIKGELRAIIEDILEHQSTAAFRARAKQVLKA